MNIAMVMYKRISQDRLKKREEIKKKEASKLIRNLCREHNFSVGIIQDILNNAERIKIIRDKYDTNTIRCYIKGLVKIVHTASSARTNIDKNFGRISSDKLKSLDDFPSTWCPCARLLLAYSRSVFYIN